ncbi:hypothetical protein AVEN_200191-1 [Araneus ventricosus]|uniref:Uncharacterized protein n=1 Tax=Araneus ventricosus TaxID=182803 RepID=A0A4Y2MFF8_ARAVE|nr:hypothetical protein AVEN_200191-1 [Araneus ventricosus]
MNLDNFTTWWKTATVLPILKPGKDSTDTISYRPISVLPILRKVAEHLMPKGLNNYLKENYFVLNNLVFEKNYLPRTNILDSLAISRRGLPINRKQELFSSISRKRLTGSERYSEIIMQSGRNHNVIDMTPHFRNFKDLHYKLQLTNRKRNVLSEKVSFRDSVKWIKVEDLGSYLYKDYYDPYTPFKKVDLRKQIRGWGQSNSSKLEILT